MSEAFPFGTDNIETGYEDQFVSAPIDRTEHERRAAEAIASLPDDMSDEQKATAVYDPVDRDAYPENTVDLSEEER